MRRTTHSSGPELASLALTAAPRPSPPRHHRRRAFRRHHHLRARQHLERATTPTSRATSSARSTPSTATARLARPCREPRDLGGRPELRLHPARGPDLPRRRGADRRGRRLHLQPRQGPGQRLHRQHAGLRVLLHRVRRAPRRSTTGACRSTSRARTHRLRPARRGLHPLQGQLRGDEPRRGGDEPDRIGPLPLASWTRGSEVVLEKVENPNSPANLERIVWRIIPEASTRSAELIAGNVDIITNVAPDQIDAVNASGAAEVQAVQGTRRMYVGFNLSETSSRPSRAATRSRTRPCAAPCNTRSTCPRSARSF
jgi:hypothetical protein